MKIFWRSKEAKRAGRNPRVADNGQKEPELRRRGEPEHRESQRTGGPKRPESPNEVETRARGQKAPKADPKFRRPPIFPPKTNWGGGKIEAGGILYI